MNEKIVKSFISIFFILAIYSCYALNSQEPIKQPPRIYIAHDFNISVYNSDTYKLIKKLPGDYSIVTTDKYLYTVGTAYIGCFDLKTLNKISDMEYDGQPVMRQFNPIISPDGSTMYIGAPKWREVEEYGVFVIDLKNKKQQKIIEKDICNGLMGSSETLDYIYIPKCNKISIVRAGGDVPFKEINLGEQEGILDLVGKNNKIYAVTCFYDGFDSRDYNVRIIDINTGQQKTVQLTPEKYKTFRVLADPKGKFIYVLGNDNMIKPRLCNRNRNSTQNRVIFSTKKLLT